MPVQLAQAARFEVEDDAGHRRRDRKAASNRRAIRGRPCERSGAARPACGTCASAAAPRGPAGWAAARPTEAARGRSRLRPLGKLSNADSGRPKFLASSGFRRVADPVGDAERAELGEVAVVEDQDEVGRLVAQAAEHVAVAAGEVPDVARLEVVGLGVALRIDDRRAHAAVDRRTPIRRRWRASAARASRPARAIIETPAMPLEIGSCSTVASLPTLPPITLPADFSSSNLNVGSSLPDSSGSGTLLLFMADLWCGSME